MEVLSPEIEKAPEIEAEQDILIQQTQPAKRYAVRMILCSAALGALIWAIRDLPLFGWIYSNPGVHALTEGYAGLLDLGLIYCMWIHYYVNGERRALLATIAFSGAGIALIVHGIASLINPISCSIIERVVNYYCIGWQIACAILLAAAARDEKVEELETVRRMGKRPIIASLSLSICLAVCLPILARCNLKLQENLPFGLGGIWQNFKEQLANKSLHDALLVTATFAALYVGANAYAKREDSFTRSLMVFGSFIALSQMADAASGLDYSIMWWLAHLFRLCGFFLLVIYMAKEFGASYSDAHARISHLEAVHYMSSSLSNTLDLRVVLLAMVSDMARMLSATYASVMLANEEGTTLTTYATYGLPEMPLNPRKPQNVEGSGRPGFYSGHTAKAFREKRIVVVDDVFADVEFIPWRVLAASSGYAVSVPLVYQDVALGVLNLFFNKHVPLNDEKMRLFQTVASAAAVAIANAQLYEKSLAADLSSAFNPASSPKIRFAS
ncbi:MAG: GAF domain-containing protein [Armatimonadota bacterium]|nr:GAF domain-containing protein [Armatimonadota bacterium]